MIRRMFAGRFCIVNKRALNVCMTVLHVCTRVLKLVQGVLHVYKRALNDVKMVLYSEQFGHEVTSSRFCAVNNLGLKLLQGVFAFCH